MEERQISGFGFIAGRWPLDQEKSTIVFIHGSGSNGHFWQFQLEGLAERVNTVALDLPGHGRSGNEGKDTVDDYSRAVAEFLDGLDVPNLIPCGLSIGGAICQQLMLDYPERFCAGILISTGAKLRVVPAIFETIEKDYSAFIDMLCKYAASPKTDPELVRHLREDLARCKPEVTYGDFAACDGFNVMEKLSKIEMPVLVISAEDDQLTPPKYGQFLQNAIRNASREHIMDAGHIVPMEKPQAVNQAIIQFLDRHGF